MRAGTRHYWLLLLISLLQATGSLYASHIPCGQVHAAARLLRANSPTALIAEKRNAPAGYAVEVVVAFRAFELRPKARALAEALLRMIPADRTQHEMILELGGIICDGESEAEMEVLARVTDSFPRMLAKAVVLAPEYMQAYVNYALMALNPHSDYAVRTQAVCKKRHQEFIKAVEALSEKDRKWFGEVVLNPKTCRAIFFPEAD